MNVLIFSTLTVGILHALAPDHWLPFVALSKVQQWSKWKLTTVTALAGLGHVSSSLMIAVVGVMLGIAVDHVSWWETSRGNIASLLLIGFGVAYLVWGIKNWGRKHSHHLDRAKAVSYWTLFALIIFGPCEPLIPLIFAGSAYGWPQVFVVFILFGLSTIGMMLLQVHLAAFGVSLLHSHRVEHASDVIAGGVIALTGVTIRLFGI